MRTRVEPDMGPLDVKLECLRFILPEKNLPEKWESGAIRSVMQTRGCMRLIDNIEDRDSPWKWYLRREGSDVYTLEVVGPAASLSYISLYLDDNDHPLKTVNRKLVEKFEKQKNDKIRFVLYCGPEDIVYAPLFDPNRSRGSKGGS